MEALHKAACFPVSTDHGIDEVHHDDRSGQHRHKKHPDIRRLPEATGYCVLQNDTSLTLFTNILYLAHMLILLDVILQNHFLHSIADANW